MSRGDCHVHRRAWLIGREGLHEASTRAGHLDAIESLLTPEILLLATSRRGSHLTCRDVCVSAVSEWYLRGASPVCVLAAWGGLGQFTRCGLGFLGKTLNEVIEDCLQLLVRGCG